MTTPTQHGPQLDMEKIATQTVQQLGAQNAMLTFELTAQRAANTAQEKQLKQQSADLEAKDQQLAEKDAELGRVRHTVEALRAGGAAQEPADGDESAAVGER